MWIYISASMVLTIDRQQRISSQLFNYRTVLQKFAAGISSEHHVFLFCEKIYCILLKKEDLDDKFLKKQVQRLLWKFNPGLEICAGIYHSDHDDTLKNAFYSGVSALTQFFYSKDPIHIYQDQTLCTFPYSIYQNLQLQLTGSNLLNTRDAVYSFMDYVRNEQPSYYELHSWLNKITLIIIKHCNDKKIPASCYIDYTESLQFLYNYHSLEEIESTILSMIESILRKLLNRHAAQMPILLNRYKTTFSSI